MALYDEDLAYVHHEGFGDYARGAAPGLLKALRSQGIESGTVVDLGCGSGIWLRALGDAGYRALGVDQSAAMLAIARRVAPDAELHCSRLDAFVLPPCDAVTAMGEALCYVAPDGRSPHLPALFEKTYAALRAGGLLVFDLLVEGEPMTYRSFRQGDDWAILFEAAEPAGQAVVTRDQTIFRRDGDRFRRSREFHRVNVHAPEQVTAQLEEVGFRVRTSAAYGDFELPLAPAGVLRRAIS